MIHSFSSEVAVEVGVTGAILLNHIFYWVEKNRTNKTNFYDGFYWTYNSINAFTELFPFYSKNTLINTLNKLEEQGYILVGNYNKLGIDRTKWYTLTEEGYRLLKSEKCIYQKEEMSFTKSKKPLPNYNQTITHNNICSSEMNESDSSLEKLETDFEKIYEIYPKKVGKAKAFTRYKQWVQKSGRKVNGRTYHLTNRQIWLAVKKYVTQLEEKDTELQYYKGFDVLMGDSLLDYVDLDK